MNCQRCKDELATLLLDAASPAAAAVQAHVDACAAELHSLRATISLLDAWTAPAPTAFFDTRLHARLREEMAAPPAGFWERMRARMLFNSSMHLRPLAIGALALALLASGGGYAGFTLLHPHHAEVSATVQDLQILDRNEQTISQMDQLDDNTTPDDSGDATQNP
jgi:hypothetical protein